MNTYHTWLVTANFVCLPLAWYGKLHAVCIVSDVNTVLKVLYTTSLWSVHLFSERREFCVATTHLLYNPKAGEVKLAQMSCLLAELHKMAKVHGKSSPHIYL